MEIDTLFGLPAHPLIVHAAVILLPLAAIGMIVVALVPRSRRHYAPLVFGVALAATVAVGLAQQSGESLQGQVVKTEQLREHTRQGDTVLPWAIAVTIVSAAVAAEPYVRDRLAKVPPKAVAGVLIAASLVAGIGATWTVVEVGHSGANSVWHDTSSG